MLNSATLTFASKYDNLIVFGDSLSDVGNIPYNHSIYGNNDPNHLSYGGRWTNGKVWNEYLAEKLGVTVPKKSRDYNMGEQISAGHTNFAHAGAWTYGSHIPVIYSIDEQISYGSDINSFDGRAWTFGENNLVAVFGGANDFLISTVNTEAKAIAAAKNAANALKTNLEEIIKLGAKNIVVFNLPDLALTPDYNVGKHKTYATIATKYTDVFNETYTANINELINSNVGIVLSFIDTHSLFEDAFKNPEKYGFKDLTTPYFDAYAKDNTVNPEDYMFFDNVHPSTKTHELLGNVVYSQVIPEPSTYAMIFGLLSLGFAYYRKRK